MRLLVTTSAHENVHNEKTLQFKRFSAELTEKFNRNVNNRFRQSEKIVSKRLENSILFSYFAIHPVKEFTRIFS